jgi:hypothetical protein
MSARTASSGSLHGISQEHFALGNKAVRARRGRRPHGGGDWPFIGRAAMLCQEMIIVGDGGHAHIAETLFNNVTTTSAATIRDGPARNLGALRKWRPRQQAVKTGTMSDVEITQASADFRRKRPVSRTIKRVVRGPSNSRRSAS